MVYAFRGSAPAGEETHTFRLGGVALAKRYRLRFHNHTLPDQEIAGAELAGAGLRVKLSLPLSSEVVFVSEIR